MDLSRAEADCLLNMPKVFAGDNHIIEFSNGSRFEKRYELHSQNTKDQFILDLERGNKRARLKFQTRAKKTVVIARIDINGKPHRNPPHAPHRPGERFDEPHIHLHFEGFGDNVAFLPRDLDGFTIPDDNKGSSWLIEFLRFCKVVQIPAIQETI